MNEKNTKTPLSNARIGVDIGRVVMCPTSELKGPDTSFLSASPERAMRIPPAPGAEDTLRKFAEQTDGNVWYVSKAGKRIQGLTKDWFRHNDFYRRAGVPAGHLRFCFKRHQKAGIARQLGLTHFIDDRTDVLEHLRGVVEHLYLFGAQSEPAPQWVTAVRDWNEIEALLLGSPPLRCVHSEARSNPNS